MQGGQRTHKAGQQGIEIRNGKSRCPFWSAEGSCRSKKRQRSVIERHDQTPVYRSGNAPLVLYVPARHEGHTETPPACCSAPAPLSDEAIRALSRHCPRTSASVFLENLTCLWCSIPWPDLVCVIEAALGDAGSPSPPAGGCARRSRLRLRLGTFRARGFGDSVAGRWNTATQEGRDDCPANTTEDKSEQEHGRNTETEALIPEVVFYPGKANVRSLVSNHVLVGQNFMQALPACRVRALKCIASRHSAYSAPTTSSEIIISV